MKRITYASTISILSIKDDKMPILYKHIRPFVWLNRLASWIFSPFVKFTDYRKIKTSEVQILEKSQAIAIDFSHYHFRENVYWKEFENFDSDDLFYVVIPNANIISKGIVLDSKNQIILESTIFQKEYLNNLYSNHLIFFNKFLPKKKEVNVISLLNKLDNNYFHWTMESLSRLLLVNEHSFFQHYRILVKADGLPFVDESLEFLFNIPRENILIKHLEENYEVENALVVSFPHIRNCETQFTNIYIPEIIKKLNKLAHHRLKSRHLEIVNGPKNFIISRKNALTRRILNEEVLIENLSDFNFETIVLENLSFEQQVVLFAASEIIIAPHGAGISNIIYSKNPILFEIFPEERDIRDAFYFTQITAALEIEHHLFLQKSENKKEDMVIADSIIDQIRMIIQKSI